MPAEGRGHSRLQPRLHPAPDPVREETRMNAQSKTAARPSASPPARSPDRGRFTPRPKAGRTSPSRSARSPWIRQPRRNRTAPTTPPAHSPTRRSRSTWKPACRRCAREWLAKRGFERITARAVKPEDNGGASGDKLVPLCPADHPVYGGKPGQLVTQMEFARAGYHHRRDDLRCASRKSRPRQGFGRRR